MAVSVNSVITGLDSSFADQAVTATAEKVMVNGDVIFTAVGDCRITNLFSECITANNATASTLQYRITPTTGSAATISGASATLANATIGTTVLLDGTALSTAPTITPSGVSFATVNRGIIFRSGTMSIVVGVGSTTGTWRHYIRYEPLEVGAYII